jgi:hypothetical protein
MKCFIDIKIFIFKKNYDSSDDEEMQMNEPMTQAQATSQINHHHHHHHHKDRQSIGHHHHHQQHTIKTTINPAFSSLMSNQSSSSNSTTFKITASAAPTVAKLIASSSVASSSMSPSSSSVLSPSLINTNTTSTNSNNTNINSNKLCSICLNKSGNSNNSSEPMVCCSTCKSFSHPNCLELNPKLVNWQCIRQYAWECMECKKCSKCSSAHDDEKMMFCDRCDRGFHTYCVNVDQVPEGSWLCKACTECVENAANDEKIIKSFCSANQLEEAKLTDSHVVLNNIAKSPMYKQIAMKVEMGAVGVLSTPQQQPASSSKIKKRLNSNDSLTAPLSTGGGGEKRKGRGRPPGSLNKPKDPNSPKKSA